MIRQLQEHGCYVIGVDMNPEAVGRWMCDEFTDMYPADDREGFLSAIAAVSVGCDVILPQSSAEVPHLADWRDSFSCPVLVSKPGPINVASNKWMMYQALEGQIELPYYRKTEPVGGQVISKALEALMMELVGIVIKPPVGKGSRGVRIIDPNVSMRDVIDGKPGSSKYATLSQIEEAYKDDFPEMLVMEKLEGEELAVDALCLDGELLLYTVRTVETQRAGVVMTGEIVDRPEIVEQTRAILRAIPLDYCVNLQFIGGKLIEINPRVSTFIYQDDVCMPWLAIQLALGEMSADCIRAYQDRIQIGRRMVRYMDQVFY